MTPYASPRILVVDDEDNALLAVEMALLSAGIEGVELVRDSRLVPGLLQQHSYALLLVDLAMPHISGIDLLEWIGKHCPRQATVVITASSDIDAAVRCMRLGAVDYLVKPVEPDRLVTTVCRVLELADLRAENAALASGLLHDRLAHPEAFNAIVTRNAGMRSIFRYVEAIASTSHPVLITGETGTGKELIARAVHALSGRQGPLVPVNAAGLDDTLFSDTLFGHVRGAFSGADRPRPGLVERASGGTLFLDEIGDLTMPSQTRLLRLLQDQEYLPLGSDMPKRSSARVVVATHRDLHAMQLAGSFRKDLYFRLAGHRIRIPPLRDRKDDILCLVDHFVREAATAMGKAPPTIPSALLSLLMRYPFPGNVRELQSAAIDAVSRWTTGPLPLEPWREAFSIPDAPSSNQPLPPPSILFPDRLPTLREAASALVAEALRRSDGNQTAAARMLGISQPALSKRLKRSEDTGPDSEP